MLRRTTLLVLLGLATACATTHPRLAADGGAGVRTVLLLPPRVEHRVLYLETEYAAPGLEDAASFAVAARTELERRGYRVIDAGPDADAARLRETLREAAFAAFARDPAHEEERIEARLADWAGTLGADAALALAGEATSETRRGRFRRLLRNYTLNLLQLPVRIGAVFLIPAVPVPNVQVYEESPSRQWMQAVLAAADGRILYMNDLTSTDSLLLDGGPRDSVEALLEELPEAK